MTAIHEIDSVLQAERLEDGTFRGSIVLNGEWSLFDGHFPGHPILPGIGMILIAERFLAKGLHRNLRLHSLKRTKFFHPAEPGTKLILNGTILNNGPDGVSGDVRITLENGDRAAAVKLILTECES